MAKVFIDGEAGTTGLGIAARLRAVPAIELISLPEAQRKNIHARLDAMVAADLTVLCLPDDAAREVAALTPSGARILDASSAHRTAPGWVYGFPEILPGQAAKIAAATLVSNPGCYATGAIALLRPLVAAGMLPADHPISINAISGYTGGGKAMIAAHEHAGGPAFELYALGLQHKHVPEIMEYGGLTQRPLFVPSVGHFPQGMLVSIPLFLDHLPGEPSSHEVAEALYEYFTPQQTVRVHRGVFGGNLRADALAGTDDMDIVVCANGAQGHAVLVASLDNLGKGASGAAVRNVQLMLGLK
jgi:N-acetyl-gamma-glutamyl-phosphate reductase